MVLEKYGCSYDMRLRKSNDRVYFQVFFSLKLQGIKASIKIYGQFFPMYDPPSIDYVEVFGAEVLSSHGEQPFANASGWKWIPSFETVSFPQEEMYLEQLDAIAEFLNIWGVAEK